METVEFRPLSLGELLDRTFTLYRSHFRLFVSIMAIPAAFTVPMTFLAISRQGSPIPFARFGQMQGASLPASYFGFLLLFWLVYSAAMGAATHAVSEVYLGRNPTMRGSYKRVRERFPGIIGLVLNVGIRVLGIFFGVVFLLAVGGIAGGAIAVASSGQRAMTVVIIAVVIIAILVGGGLAIFLALRYSVAIPAFMFENLGTMAAVRRSVQLTKGRRGHIFLAALLATIVGYVGIVVFRGPFWLVAAFTARNVNSPAWLNLATATSGAVGAAITGPLLMIILVLCYYDLRIRKEAFDLQFMMTSLDNSASAAGTASPA